MKSLKLSRNPRVVVMRAMLFQKPDDHVDRQLDVVKVSIRQNTCLDLLGFFVHSTNLFCDALDKSAYVEYSSSSEEDEKTVTKKPVKRRRDDSDSGSDVSIHTTTNDFFKLRSIFCFRKKKNALEFFGFQIGLNI